MVDSKENGFAKKLFSPIIAIVGPAAVMAAGIMGAGSTVSLLSSGCWFGYTLLWAIFLSLPVIIICQDTASRIGAVSGGKGMMKIISDEIHPIVTIVIVIPVLFTCISANVGQLSAMAAGMSNIINLAADKTLIPANPSSGVNIALMIPLAVLSLLVNSLGGYKRIEKLLTFLLFTVILCFSIVAIQAFFHISEIKQMLAGLMPSIPDDIALGDGNFRRAAMSFASIIGGGVAATAILSFPYFTTEGGYNMENIKARFRKHLLLFGLIFGLYSCILMIAGAFALNPMPGSATFDGARLMGMALQNTLGPIGSVFFSIGLFICGFNTLTVVAQLGSYFVMDILGKDWRFQKKNKAFLVPFTAFIILPALIGAFWHIPNLIKVIIGMAINVLVAPLAIVLIIYLINKKNFAGELKASMWRNLFLLYSLAVILMTAANTIIKLAPDIKNIFNF